MWLAVSFSCTLRLREIYSALYRGRFLESSWSEASVLTSTAPMICFLSLGLVSTLSFLISMSLTDSAPGPVIQSQLGIRSRDQSRPIRGQYSRHIICLDQSEASTTAYGRLSPPAVCPPSPPSGPPALLAQSLIRQLALTHIQLFEQHNPTLPDKPTHYP